MVAPAAGAQQGTPPAVFIPPPGMILPAPGGGGFGPKGRGCPGECVKLELSSKPSRLTVWVSSLVYWS